ncbi:alpha-1,2-rhamnosyltransferase [Pseudomonas prosekii]|uniref:Alpha-1,2-rhamnosyltransferase n=1 Tax=Pseudomonas prosekii TaxID=1148509 RepID=A0A1H1WAV8_9PSED|nr:glycosyltransferase family 1 protein [Pseudomonas prosekii]SDS93566.1 alpha-1,2-rhamnosyltransferase [Pseudomonas prosekii]
MTRLLVECTYVFEHPNANSGIQRVVRNVIQQLPAKDAQRECIPVVMIDGALFEVKSLAPLKTPKINLTSLRVKLEQWANLFWLRHRTLERRRPFRESKFARRVLYVMCRLAAFACLSLPIRVLDRLLKGKPVPERCVPLQHRAGDQLVLLDSSWHANFFPLAEQLKRDGVGIVSVIYDLIPLTHPQFCDAGLVKVFNEWFDWIARTADGYVAISTTIRDQVRDEMLRRVGPQQVQQRWFDYFHLGSELDLSDARAEVDRGLLQMFKTPEPVFLMVSTIEPRKNHAYLLDAFERAWAAGSTARLCIAGKIGWKCDALVERIREHPELNRRLFMFNTLSDRSLEHAYSHATALVFPSYVEGFGLPLVEAMQRGLPAMGSDIPVFREIGGDYMAYFDLAEPQSLTDLVTDMERSGVFPAALGLAQWRWLSWREASAQLVERIERNLNRPLSESESESQPEPEPEFETEQQRQQPESQHANCP